VLSAIPDECDQIPAFSEAKKAGTRKNEEEQFAATSRDGVNPPCIFLRAFLCPRQLLEPSLLLGLGCGLWHLSRSFDRLAPQPSKGGPSTIQIPVPAGDSSDSCHGAFSGLEPVWAVKTYP
jgi:hypothetical protein